MAWFDNNNDLSENGDGIRRYGLLFSITLKNVEQKSNPGFLRYFLITDNGRESLVKPLDVALIKSSEKRLRFNANVYHGKDYSNGQPIRLHFN